MSSASSSQLVWEVFEEGMILRPCSVSSNRDTTPAVVNDNLFEIFLSIVELFEVWDSIHITLPTFIMIWDESPAKFFFIVNRLILMFLLEIWAH